MPSADHDICTSQLAENFLAKEDPFIKKDNAWYAIEHENPGRLTFKYSVANLDDRCKAE